MADRAVGGFSTASLDYEPAEPSSNTPSHARFHGSISTKLPDNWRVERTGMFATQVTHLSGLERKKKKNN
jgi:Complex I intermediate-associated protein 30 (CIA30).